MFWDRSDQTNEKVYKFTYMYSWSHTSFPHLESLELLRCVANKRQCEFAPTSSRFRPFRPEVKRNQSICVASKEEKTHQQQF